MQSKNNYSWVVMHIRVRRTPCALQVAENFGAVGSSCYLLPLLGTWVNTNLMLVAAVRYW